MALRSRIADPALAGSGHRAIEWVKERSPVLDGYVREVLADGALHGRRVAVVVHLEAKTAFLATVLADAGATVVAAGSNPWTTRDDVCAALVERGIEVHASRRSPHQEWEEDLLAVADTGPELIVDDGAELTVRMARDRPDGYVALRGVSEETTTGVDRLRRLEAAGRLPFPAIAANDAALKHLFDNRYGTGQTTIQAILQLTNLRLPGKRVAVIGYGWVGRGIAAYTRSLGGRVAVVEVDPVRALEAHTEGLDVAPLPAALRTADIVVTATGSERVVGAPELEALRDGVVLANAGHHDLEIDVPALAAHAEQQDEVRPAVTRYRLDGRDIFLLAGGALVNIAGGLGHPVEIMDLSFSVQALGSHTLATADLAPGVHELPRHLDEAIAVARLADRGIHLDRRPGQAVDTLAGILEPGAELSGDTGHGGSDDS